MSVFEHAQAHNCTYTIFSAFHHFKRSQAIEIIKSKVSDNSDLVIFEMTLRNRIMNYLWLPGGIFAFMLSPFMAQKWSWKKFLISTIFPVVPLMVIYDGLISNLRTYTESELRDMVDQASRETGLRINMDYKENNFFIGVFSYYCRFYV